VPRLVCVSNRIALPRSSAAAGGLAVGILAALRHTGGLWFGWSGELAATPAPATVLTRGRLSFATVDLPQALFEGYYNGYCNGTLWPLFHYFPERFTHEQRDYEAYQAVNAHFARSLAPLLRTDDVVWVHDYQLIPLGAQLRRAGFTGRIGFFLHIPFPHIQILRLLPNYAALIEALCQYDQLGFQTQDDVESFLSSLAPGTPVRSGSQVELHGRSVRVGAYPIGIDVQSVEREAQLAVRQEAVERMRASLMGRRLIVGVDRLDYTKGLTERFAGFEQFLENSPVNHGKVTFLQIAPVSRADVLAYGEIRRSLEHCAGRVNGTFGEVDWTPIRYINRNYGHATIMGFLRAAQVAVVTPVRDGMNLVAKEFVAAQDPADPGVLLLSPMAGAARELGGALLVNPYDKPGMAQALQSALDMPLAERQNRHRQMLEAVRQHDIHRWYGDFIGDLTGEEWPQGRSRRGALRSAPVVHRAVLHS
jgi:trehalose 6-phosphate synthase